MGSVSPLVAIFEELKKSQPEAEFLWLATKTGPEEKLIRSYGLPVKKIFAGKFRRYFSWRNLLDPIFILLGFFQAAYLIIRFKPDWILTAGGFVSVPVVWAGGLLGTKILVHQQDVIPGLANKLMSPFATKITVVFNSSAKSFPSSKVVLVGNPVRSEIFSGSKARAVELLKLASGLPTLLVIGGGTGAKSLNDLVAANAAELVSFCQVIHLTGGKLAAGYINPRYHPVDFLISELSDVYAASDLIVTRAGLATLSELSVIAKPLLVMPLPDSHQEANATELEKHQAVVVLSEKKTTAAEFVTIVRNLILDQSKLESLSRNIRLIMPPNGAEAIAKLIYE